MLTRVFLIASLLAFAAGTRAAAAATAPNPIERGTLAGVRDLGRAADSQRVRVAIVLNYHHDSELEWLTQAQADPDSPLYHHFLTTAQFAAYFAPTPDEYARVASSLARGGFTITHESANRTVIDA